MTRKGNQLRVGDTIEVFWKPGRDTITKLSPYHGAYERDPQWQGVKVAEFSLLRGGMTVFPDELYEVV